MSYIIESLSAGEEVKAIFKYHWFIWIPIIIKIFSLILLPFGIYDIFVLKTTEFGLTNKRVVFKKGIISRNTEEMNLKSVETVEIRQGIFGRIFGYGMMGTNKNLYQNGHGFFIEA